MRILDQRKQQRLRQQIQDFGMDQSHFRIMEISWTLHYNSSQIKIKFFVASSDEV